MCSNELCPWRSHQFSGSMFDLPELKQDLSPRRWLHLFWSFAWKQIAAFCRVQAAVTQIQMPSFVWCRDGGVKVCKGSQGWTPRSLSRCQHEKLVLVDLTTICQYPASQFQQTGCVDLVREKPWIWGMFCCSEFIKNKTYSFLASYRHSLRFQSRPLTSGLCICLRGKVISFGWSSLGIWLGAWNVCSYLLRPCLLSLKCIQLSYPAIFSDPVYPF